MSLRVGLKWRDGQPVVFAHCPKCLKNADVDEDQFFGRVSLDCPTEGCDFHETHDLSQLPMVTGFDVQKLREELDA